MNPQQKLLSLTKREKEYIRYVYEEKTDHEIAASMNVSFNTVRSHRRNVMRKLGVNKAIGIVKYAIECKLV
ncbi:MAG: LuxR family transcriptional regulator [Bacteroidetes bacterium]|nr:MAG: LuxR family transcriptional regulator [Bacteroidota bacterium]